MTTYVLRNGKLVEKHRAAPKGGVHIWRDLPGYRSPLGTGWIEGRAARREDLKRGHCREVDPTEFKAEYHNERFARKHGLPLADDRPARPTTYDPDPQLTHLQRELRNGR